MGLPSPKKILAIKVRSLGDTVLFTAVLRELRLNFPKAEVHALVQSDWADLLENFDGLSRVWTMDRKRDSASRTKALAFLAFKLRREKFDWVINCHASPSSSLLAFSTGAPVRAVHFHGHEDANKYSTVEIPGKGSVKPIIDRDFDTLRAVGLEVDFDEAKTFIKVSPEEQAWAESQFDQLGLVPPVMTLNLGASKPTKIWPVERFYAVAEKWIHATNGSVLVIEPPGESHLVDHFFEVRQGDSADRIIDPLLVERMKRIQKLSLRQLVAILRVSDIVLGNDSGPRHLAVAVGTPTVTVSGPEDPFEWHPYSKEEHPIHFVADLSCRKDARPGYPPWCGLQVCVEENHRCMTGITVDAVLKSCIDRYQMRATKWHKSGAGR